MEILKISYTESEAYNLLKKIYPDTFLILIKKELLMLKRVQKHNDISLTSALYYCLRLQDDMTQAVRYLAAYHFNFKLNKNMNIQNEINAIDHEINKMQKQAILLESNTFISNEEKGKIRQVYWQNAEELKTRRRKLKNQFEEIFDLEVEATIVRPNGTERRI